MAEKKTLTKILQENKENSEKIFSYSISDNVVVNIKRWIKLEDIASVVSDVINTVFSKEEDGRDVYYPYMLNFSINYCLIKYYTDITISKNLESVNELIFSTGIISEIMEKTNAQFVIDAIINSVEYRKEMIIKNSSPITQIFNSLSSTVSKLGEALDGINEENLLDMVKDYIDQM